jgi:hypothetical protein
MDVWVGMDAWVGMDVWVGRGGERERERERERQNDRRHRGEPRRHPKQDRLPLSRIWPPTSQQRPQRPISVKRDLLGVTNLSTATAKTYKHAEREG